MPTDIFQKYFISNVLCKNRFPYNYFKICVGKGGRSLLVSFFSIPPFVDSRVKVGVVTLNVFSVWQRQKGVVTVK